MKEPTTENRPVTVAGAGNARLFPKQAGETLDRWSWVERSVWTERMLNRLAESQEQTVWFSLWDKVWNSDNLSQATGGYIKWWQCRNGWTNHGANEGKLDKRAGTPTRRTAPRPVPSATSTQGLDTQAWNKRAASIRSTRRQGPHSTGGITPCLGTYL